MNIAERIFRSRIFHSLVIFGYNRVGFFTAFHSSLHETPLIPDDDDDDDEISY